MDNASATKQQAATPNLVEMLQGKTKDEINEVLRNMPKEQLIALKGIMDKQASKVAHKPIETGMRSFMRNIGQKTAALADKIAKGATKLNTLYLANYMYTMYTGAFVGSVLTCAAIIFQFVVGALGTATLLTLIGSAIFLLPVLIFCVYIAIRFIVEVISGGISLIKNLVTIGKIMKSLEKSDPSANPFQTAVDKLQELVPQPANKQAPAAAY